MGRAFAELVDDVRSLPEPERRELKFLIERSLVEERRQEIAESHRQSHEEVEAGTVEFSVDLDRMRADLER